MKGVVKFILMFVTSLISIQCSIYNDKEEQITWKEFNQETFDRAENENKLVLLDLKANWCHWCHVMDDSTYQNKSVMSYLNKHFVCVKVDQDANPYLANKYRKYGWPATIVFDAKGNELTKKSGYINPRKFELMLQGLTKTPATRVLTANKNKEVLKTPMEVRVAQIQKRTEAHMDVNNGGYNQYQRFIDIGAFEYAVANYSRPGMKEWIEASIKGAYKLQDSEWGGIYQYSTYRSWNNPHYEKLLSMQAKHIQIFTNHFSITGKKRSLKEAEKIISYCDRFLSLPDGLYANSQDADLQKGKHSKGYYNLEGAERYKRGIPPIDASSYTNTNAMIAEAIYRLGMATNKDSYKEKGLSIMKRLISSRKTENGLFAHDDKFINVVLEDNIAMARAMLSFFNFTQDIYFKKNAIDLLNKMSSYSYENVAFADNPMVSSISRAPELKENIRICRVYNLAGHLFNEEQYIQKAKLLLNFLYSNDVSGKVGVNGPLIMAAQEVNRNPQHIVVVMPRNAGRYLLQAVKCLPVFYKKVEFIAVENLSKNQKDLFGSVKEVTAFSCSENSCSKPVRDVEDVINLINL